MVSSFRDSRGSRPPRYRTPSPPIHAIESSSPPHHPEFDDEASALQRPFAEHPSNHYIQPRELHAGKSGIQRRTSHLSQDAMDTFASIALSATSEWPPNNKRNPPATPTSDVRRSSHETLERPSKRARSAKLPSPEWVKRQSNASPRPTTSYESVAERRRMDAELLLNFSQVARSSVSAVATPYNAHSSGIMYRNDSSGQETASLLGNSGTTGFCYSETPRVDSTMRHSRNCMAENAPGPNQSTQRPALKYSPTYENQTHALEKPLHDFRHQFVEASNPLQHQACIPNAADGTNPITAPHKSQQMQRCPHSSMEEHHLRSASAQSEEAAAADKGPARCSEDTIAFGNFGSTYEKLRSGHQLAFTDWKNQTSAIGYWPTMLATTVEQSASAWKSQLTKALEELGSKGQQKGPERDEDVIPKLTDAKGPHTQEPATCAACKFTRNSMNVENDGDSASWISCDGCKSWFHFACAGFKSEREVRAVDKYRCRKCKAIYGPTTYVRKSARAHTAIDYAGLNQGVVKTSDERPEHHYIKPIKDGTINLQPENFARMRPEFVTAEYFEKGNGMKEPIVIPAHFNPRPMPAGSPKSSSDVLLDVLDQHESDTTLLDHWFSRDPECQNVPDLGQDALDMVIPSNLTVRQVAELYGPEEKVEVIDVKSQNGEGKKWNMKRWVDYYESASNKVVRNVISLEVSQSTLGRLIRRPQIVRDLDLQDAVWPAELQAKGEIPRVQFYCLMSVADCFTDFHIDFGGSSVFYHILKGKKTFFFIPPKEKHLKKYEEWCMSPAQNWTFLADQTKECYRVDLSVGDTMLIPAGWIHAVWTPEDSLVIGGNFLTRLNYSMQLRIAQVEKATGVARKFRYPHFQKIQWYTAMRYLESDPIPSNVCRDLQAGGVFHRQHPAYHDFNSWGQNSRSGPENYHARYYSQSELEGLPDLVRYLLRTALIDSGDITEGITVEARNAVKKSIPRGFGEPLEIVKDFAIWCAWKRGNELIPHWAYPDALPEARATESTAKLSAAALKKLDHETAPQAPRRHSSRNRIQQPFTSSGDVEMTHDMRSHNSDGFPSAILNTQPRTDGPLTPSITSLFCGESQQHAKTPIDTSSRKRKIAQGTTATIPRKTACESCRRRRRACGHKTNQNPQVLAASSSTLSFEDNQPDSGTPLVATTKTSSETNESQNNHLQASQDGDTNMFDHAQHMFTGIDNDKTKPHSQPEARATTGVNHADTIGSDILPDIESAVSAGEADRKAAIPPLGKKLSQKSSSPKQGRGRSKACNDCRKSKRRCLHDENGNEDPLKVQEAATSRSVTGTKRRKLEHDGYNTTITQQATVKEAKEEFVPTSYRPAPSVVPFYEQSQMPAPPAVMVADGLPVGRMENDHQPSSDVTQQLQISEPGIDTQELMQTRAPTSVVELEIKHLTLPPVHNQEVAGTQAIVLESAEGLSPGELRAATTTPIQATKYEIPTQPLGGSSFEQPAASSLVSPPASSHDESERPISTADPKFSYSGSSSRHSSRHPMQAHRFTPESGPARRDSSSSVIADATQAEAAESTGTSPLSVRAPDSVQKRMRARLGSEIEADEESLRLIKALQAEEYGLRMRRTSRVP